MPAYHCIAVDSSGRRREFIKIADSQEAAERSFATGEWYLVSILAEGRRNKTTLRKRYPENVIREFTELTSVLLESGLTLKDALIVEKEIFSGKLRSTLMDDLITTIDKGESFIHAIESCGEAFPSIYRGMIRIGDRTGSIEKMFPRLAEYLVEKKRIKDFLLGALMYPTLVLIMVIAGMIGISVFLLPQLLELFSQLGGDAAKILSANAGKMKIALLFFLVIVVFLIVALPILGNMRKRNERVAIQIDNVILHTPWVGNIVKSYQTMNFAFAMEALSSGGITMEVALEEAKAVVGNAAYRHAIDEVRNAIVRGEPLSAACSARNEFPKYVSRWLSVGERSGQADRVFSQIRKYFQNDMERLTSRAMSLAEPILILIVGGIVLWAVVSFILPLFSIYNSVL